MKILHHELRTKGQKVRMRFAPTQETWSVALADRFYVVSESLRQALILTLIASS
jgi:hypothetical protein